MPAIFTQHPLWPVIDVSERAIEETAAILRRIRDRRARGIVEPLLREELLQGSGHGTDL